MKRLIIVAFLFVGLTRIMSMNIIYLQYDNQIQDTRTLQNFIQRTCSSDECVMYYAGEIYEREEVLKVLESGDFLYQPRVHEIYTDLNMYNQCVTQYTHEIVSRSGLHGTDDASFTFTFIVPEHDSSLDIRRLIDINGLLSRGGEVVLYIYDDDSNIRHLSYDEYVSKVKNNNYILTF